MFNWFKKKKTPSNVVRLPMPPYINLTADEWGDLAKSNPEDYRKRVIQYSEYLKRTL